MTDFIGSLWNWLNNPIIFGIPAWVIIAVLLLVLYLIWKPKQKFKRKDTKKELDKSLKKAFKAYGTKIEKRIDFGMFPKGHILKSNVMFWDRNLKFLIHYSDRKLKKFLKNNKEYTDKNGNLKKDFIKINAFLVCGKNIIWRLFGKLGFGNRIYLIPDEYILENKDIVVVNPLVSPKEFFGIYIIGEESRQIIEDICFRLNRENELDELVNQIPKQNYLEVSTAGLIARAREKAKIEKEKYKGQIEGAEEG